MRASIILIFLISFILCEKRLIQFNETSIVQLNETQIQELINKHINFMDITDLKIVPRKVQGPLNIPKEPKNIELVKKLNLQLSTNELAKTITKLSSFHTRYYTTQTGKDSSIWLHEEFKSLTNSAVNTKVEYFPHSWAQQSVIAKMIGTEKPEEIVIIAAHIDSVNGGATGRAPGADDDASGISLILEVFRVLQLNGFQSKRTLEFHAYSAEEVGLRGSQAIAADYQRLKKKVVGMMQLDQTSYSKLYNVIGTMTDYSNPDLTQLLRKIIEVYANKPWKNMSCGYACTDSASWHLAGFPASHQAESAPLSDTNPFRHSARDVIDALKMEHGLEMTKVGLGYMVEMGLH